MLSPAIMLYEETFHTISEQAKPAELMTCSVMHSIYNETTYGKQQVHDFIFDVRGICQMELSQSPELAFNVHTLQV